VAVRVPFIFCGHFSSWNYFSTEFAKSAIFTHWNHTCVMVSIFEYTVSESHIVPNTSEYCLKSFVTDCTMYIPHFMLILQVHCCPLNFLNSGRALNTHRFLYISFYDVRSQLIFFNVNDQNIKALEKVVLSKYSN